MPRRLPSLSALKAFEAAARDESFTKAAQALCVTQGAVSQQVKALEDELGLRLFVRTRHRLASSSPRPAKRTSTWCATPSIGCAWAPNASCSARTQVR